MLADPYARIAELEEAVAERDAVIAAQAIRITDLEALVVKLMARIDELERQINRNSGNSSTPPSANPPNAPKPPPKKPSGRKPGGQTGHRGSNRALVKPDKVVDHFPGACGRCQAALTETIDAEPVRHQVTDLPPICVETVEHRLHASHCKDCGTTTRATLPTDVPTGQFGPRLIAMVAGLSGRLRVSRREAAFVCTEMFGTRLSVGTVQAMCEWASAALCGTVAEVAQVMQAAPVVYADETGWRHAGKKHWLWMVSSKAATVFKIQAGRGHEALDHLLSRAYPGIVVSDRWHVYNRYPLRGLCHAHLLRNWAEIAECKDPEAKRLGEWAVSETYCLLRWHRQVREGVMTLEGLQQRMRLLKGRYAKILRLAKASSHKRTRTMGTQLEGHWDSLWTFASTPGVDPTNNHGEQQIRPAVLWRKGSFGTWGEAGKVFVERMLTVAATAKQQGVRFLDFLVAACQARLTGQAAPSLFAQAH
jgi:transposase